MALNVKFLKGTVEQYNAIDTKDVNTFYYIGGTDLYLGKIKLSNAADLQAAIIRIAANETKIGNIATLTTTDKTDLVKAINELKAEITTLTGGESGGISNMIASVTGDLSTLTTDAKTNLVAAINELDAALDTEKTASKVTIDTTTTSEGMSKSYTVKQGATTVGVIDIPKDMVVSAATVETNPEDQPAGTYIVLTIANATQDKIYVNVGKLVDIYTAEASATQVQLTINQSTNKISATLVDGGVTKIKLAQDVLNAFDAAGSAATAESNAKAYTDAQITANALVWGEIETTKDK